MLLCKTHPCHLRSTFPHRPPQRISVTYSRRAFACTLRALGLSVKFFTKIENCLNLRIQTDIHRPYTIELVCTLPIPFYTFIISHFLFFSICIIIFFENFSFLCFFIIIFAMFRIKSFSFFKR